MSDGNGEVNQEELMATAQRDLYNSRREEDTSGDHSAISDSKRSQSGVLIKAMTAVDDKDYRQALLLGDFMDPEEADRVTAALNEANRYGLPPTPIIDWIYARCAVTKNGQSINRLTEVIQGITHSTFMTQGMNKNNKPQTSNSQKTEEG